MARDTLTRAAALCAAAVTVVLFAVSAGAAGAGTSLLTNPGFETGDLTGWTPVGDVWVDNTGAPEGMYLARLATEDEDYGGPGPGSTLSQTVTAKKGDVITGAARWFAEDTIASGEYYDIGTVRIDTGSDWVVVFYADTDPTGWTTWTYTVPADGDYTVIAHVENTEDNSVTSTLGIDSAVAAPGRAGYCSVAGNTNYWGVALPPGTFLDLATSQPETNANYKGAVPANYLQGVGLTCDVLPGFTKTGQTVGATGPGSPGTYPYYTKG
jgi:hypothetical protein